jgi:hypothetical protein
MGSTFSCFIVKDIYIPKKNIICNSNNLSNIKKNDNELNKYELNKNSSYLKKIELDESDNNRVFFKD